MRSDVARRDIQLAAASAFTTTESVLVFGADLSTPATPRHGIPISIPRDQLWFWQTEWLAGEHRASAQIAAGRTVTYDNDDDFLTSL